MRHPLVADPRISQQRLVPAIETLTQPAQWQNQGHYLIVAELSPRRVRSNYCIHWPEMDVAVQNVDFGVLRARTRCTVRSPKPRQRFSICLFFTAPDR